MPLAATLSVLLAMTNSAHAQSTEQAANFPSKTVKIVVPFAAGGVSDVLARTLGQKLSETWKQPVVIENRAGADGNLGADVVAKSQPDGYTVLLVDTSTITTSPVLMARMSYDPLKDLSPISLLTLVPPMTAERHGHSSFALESNMKMAPRLSVKTSNMV